MEIDEELLEKNKDAMVVWSVFEDQMYTEFFENPKMYLAHVQMLFLFEYHVIDSLDKCEEMGIVPSERMREILENEPFVQLYSDGDIRSPVPYSKAQTEIEYAKEVHADHFDQVYFLSVSEALDYPSHVAPVHFEEARYAVEEIKKTLGVRVECEEKISL